MSKSLGKYLDGLVAGVYTKQETVTALQKQRNRLIKQAKTEEAKLWLTKFEETNDVKFLNWADERISELKQDSK